VVTFDLRGTSEDELVELKAVVRLGDVLLHSLHQLLVTVGLDDLLASGLETYELLFSHRHPSARRDANDEVD
jgi:hypothetical protein